MSEENRRGRGVSEREEAVDISDERDWRRVDKERGAAVSAASPSDEEGKGGTGGAVVAAMQADSKRPSMYRLIVVPEGSAEQETLTVHEDTLVAWRLLKGRRLTAEEWAALRREEQKEEAYRSALAMLDFKARTQNELRQGLKRKGYSPDAIAGSIERLLKHGLLDDAAYAKRFAESRVSGQKKGRRLIRQELLQRGVGKGDVEEALEELDEGAERRSALTLARKRWPGVKGKTLRERQMKLMAVLLRRGFPNGIAYEAVREASAEMPEEEAPDWEEPAYVGPDDEGLEP
ncbi:regulatory protein RecX [Cohnella sp. REN36]|uniref:regulatory protein RecX n=1 Tax=Cohnella sp. REN36 TaxID=2887347 RepID=UPI001D149257|nr:RecX family transcriptional regulator [Cohnella sp. REN36]MCC3371797.1 RecX family transcriptional regulator [Cohnella sp. REN36]